MTKFYSIYAFIGGEWSEYNGIEYTEQEANEELRLLKSITAASSGRSVLDNVKPYL